MLQIVQQAMDMIGVVRPSSLVGEADPDLRRMLATANRVGRELAKRDWSVLQKEYTFTTTSGTTEYTLPTDWARSIDDTAYDVNEYERMRGSMTPQDWRYLKNTLGTSAYINDTYRIKQNTSGNSRAWFIDPAPASGKSLIYEYISKNWVLNSAGTVSRSSFAADNDKPIFDDLLFELGVIAYFKRETGLDYTTDYAEYQSELDRVYAQDVPRRKQRTGGQKLFLWGNIPEVGYGS